MSEDKAAITPAEPVTAPPVPEPTGPGTAVAAQEQLKSTEPKPTILGEQPGEVKTTEAPAAFEAEKITFPEGFQRNNELFGKFSEIAKANGLTLPVAQQLSDLYVTAAKQVGEANRTAWNTTLAGWETEVKADGEIAKATLKSGESTLTGLDAVKATVAKMLDNTALTHPKFREALEVTGIGSHPAAVVTLYRWAKAFTEGQSVQGNPNMDPTKGPTPGSKTNEPVSAAKALYPNNP